MTDKNHSSNDSIWLGAVILLRVASGGIVNHE